VPAIGAGLLFRSEMSSPLVKKEGHLVKRPSSGGYGSSRQRLFRLTSKSLGYYAEKVSFSIVMNSRQESLVAVYAILSPVMGDDTPSVLGSRWATFQNR
jgi:hypothetical protein